MEACYQHPGVESVAFCGRCANPICAVCKFDALDGARCPACVEVGARPTAASRSGGVASFVLAIGSGFLLMVFFVVAALQEEQSPDSEALLGLMFLLPLGGTVAGLAFGLIARDEARRRGSLLASVGIAGNGLLLSVLLLMACVGNFLE